MRIKIAFVQLLPVIDLDENLDIGKKACVEAKEKGADSSRIIGERKK